MKRKLTITYSWEHENVKEISDDHQKKLDKTAIHDINEFIMNNQMEGEFFDSYRDPDGEYISYCCKWKATLEIQ